jgi:hypothetical protein
MRQVQIRAGGNEEAECLMRELAAYSPARSGRSLRVELEDRSRTDLVALLAAVETCITANDIRSVRVELDGQAYLLAAKSPSR